MRNMATSTTYSRESHYDIQGSSLDRSLCDGHILVQYILPFLSSFFAVIGDLKFRISIYRLRPGRCVSADPAADFAAFEALGFRSVLEAALAAFLLVTSLAPLLLRTCVNADPAALLAALLAVWLRKTFDAADAARFPVTSVLRLVAISMFLTLNVH